jgi:hypothetical protein
MGQHNRGIDLANDRGETSKRPIVVEHLQVMTDRLVPDRLHERRGRLCLSGANARGLAGVNVRLPRLPLDTFM